MRVSARGLVLGSLAIGSLTLIGCKVLQGTSTSSPKATARGIPKPLAIRSNTETLVGSAVVGSGDVVWEATPAGLLRWDSNAGTSQLLTATDGLPSNRIAALAVDAAGSLWIATNAGLSHELKGGKWKNYPTPPVGDRIAAMRI